MWKILYLKMIFNLRRKYDKINNGVTYNNIIN